MAQTTPSSWLLWGVYLERRSLALVAKPKGNLASSLRAPEMSPTSHSTDFKEVYQLSDIYLGTLAPNPYFFF